MKKDHLNTTGFDLWHTIREETATAVSAEPMLASFLHQTVLRHESLGSVLAYHLSSKLGSPIMDVRALFEIYQQALGSDTQIGKCVEADLKAIYERDPACDEYSLPLLYFKGFHAIQAHRINHRLYLDGRKTLAYFLQNRMSEVFGVDIHPAARFGYGLMLDHATGFVAGETAVLGNNISILHGVTLGGSGKEGGDRHPKIGDGVMIGANASILGNIRIGSNAKIGAGSVVVSDVPPSITVVGVPAKPVARSLKTPSADMDQNIQFTEIDFMI
ncbi:TPA: serine O-acetyltransferase [Neisseria meningitidis]|uniref:serine O-acetyltransferase n=1 Tax=Neisseria meningitidis TaxID=487 RepID=UPI000E590376|nr:serine O-acetyltransferase [Neisseria meningitidis]MBH2049892.1 serine O-acetyltransferase [Neisseria meningitidis]MBH2083224.1 serine O-acetyltransferase [Neisseria meningitidis]MBH2250913.1 serine O-acetyltransferase [Neisseria meningitidis]MBH5798686.1 serine O-acetyltransferase [Neisseria meningitidis]MBH5889296.1 serine O-acetyltransferase [Neisseria meningitidis]